MFGPTERRIRICVQRGPGVWMMESLALLCLSISVMMLSAAGSAAPAPDLYSRGLDWLTRYGYLPPPDPRTGRLQTREGIEAAIKQMQRFAGLKETGQLDRDTLKLMSTPRCSLPDVVGSEDMLRRRKRYTLSGSQWENTNLDWSVLSYPTLQSSLKEDLVETIMYYALKVWSNSTNLQFLQRPKNNANQAAIRISFHRSFHEDGYPFDGKGGTLAHAFFPGQADISGDTHFDDEETWTYGAPDGVGTDLFTVAVHEFGHALGLSHSSADPSIMRPYYQGSVGDIANYRLPMDDQLAIQALYGIKSNRATTPHVHPTPRLPEIPKSPTPREHVPPDPGYQDRCEGGFDAVADIRGDVFFFKGPYFWRIQRSGSLVSLAPAQIKNFWIGLPPDVEKIDAVYERKTDSHIVFFIGSQFWVFKDTKAMPGYPRPLSNWGMRTLDGRLVDRVEAAFVWAHNGQTYLFSGGEFWRFSERPGTRVPQPDADYPRKASLWKGVPGHPDDIISWGKAGDTYFFKDNSYWALKRGGMDQEVVSPKSTAVDWMHCSTPPPSTQSPNNPCSWAGKCRCPPNDASKLTGHSWLLIVILFQCVTGFI
ncbi:matrix metalloproteinase-25 [Trichomycterus rosablanca]|uniref:matrix metalloproteinase-25 n=1 Tax=Trichomycterus rosablanca TaxID=2290929 RepID=UPI002F35F464